MKRLHYALTFALLTSASVVFAGWNVPVTNFAVADYSAGTQNWQLVTTDNGWLYAANNYGLLEYDGAQWRVYGMYYGNLPRSITKFEERAIFIGATNDIGVFTPTTNGAMHYTSLIGDIDPTFGEIWDIEVVGRQVYFFARHRIIVGALTDSVSLTDVRAVQTDSRIFCAEEIGGAIYVGTDDGLYLLSGTRMNRIHGSDILRGYEVRCIQALDDSRLLIATDLGGLFLYDGSQITPFRTDADTFLRKNQLYTFAVRDRTIALGTVLQGIVVMDTDGHRCRYISRKDGLQNNTILSMTFDNRANLWVGLDQGIDYVQLASTRQYLSDEQTNFGAGYAALRVQHDGRTRYYYGTNQALYTKTDTTQPLQLVAGSMGQVWSLAELDGTVFCCHNRGLFVVDGEHMHPLCTDEGFWKVQRLPDGRVLAGSYSGFRVLERSNGKWQVTKIQGFDDTAFRWQVDAQGTIWAVDASGVVRLTWQNATTLATQSVQPYNASHDWLNISRLGDNILISSLDYCRVVTPDGTLRRDTALFAQLGGETYYALTMQDAEGNILFVRDGILYLSARDARTNTQRRACPLYSGETDFIGGFENVYPAEGGYVVGTLQGFCLLQPSNADGLQGPTAPKLYLRQVSLVNHDGQVVYGESFGEMSATGDICMLPYDNYALRFNCSIDRTPAGNTQYAFRLLPRDKEFTPMNSRAYYECSSLEQSRYTLQVICRTAQENQPTTEVMRSWTFTIRPPWYRTWWARTLLVLLIVCWLLVLGYMIYVLADRSKRKTLHEQQLRILHLENDRSQYRLQAKSQELTRILHEEAGRQEELASITEVVDKSIRDLQAHNLKKVEERLQALRQRLMQEKDDSIDWQRFEENFDEVNAGFCKQLTKRYPWMSKQERKLCVYIRMGMLTKEMAPMLGLSTRGVEMLRYRMRCKMELESQANLKDYLTQITSND